MLNGKGVNNNLMKKVSKMDEEYISTIRKNVSQFLKNSASNYDKEGAILLDIAPQDHEGAAPYFTKSKISTLDIDSKSGATYIADLCKKITL